MQEVEQRRSSCRESLHKDVVQCSTPPVHANDNPVRLEYARKRVTGELAALIGVEDLGRSIRTQRLFQTVHTEATLQRVR